MSDLTDRIAEVLAKHLQVLVSVHPGTLCTCGVRTHAVGTSQRDSEHRTHQAEQIAAVVREGLAEAWDEGFHDGWHEREDPSAFVNDVWDVKIQNPYRKDDNR